MAEQLFCSLSQLIIDEIKFPDGTIQRDVLGGGGAHAIYGMRLWFSPPESQNIAYLVHAGYDFPPSIVQNLLALNISLTLTLHSTLPSIRGFNTFTTPDHRLFTYLTPPIGTVPADLPACYLRSRIFHFVCSPARAQQHVSGILELRDKSLPRPIFVWEPIPENGTRENFKYFLEAMKIVDIISPSHEEAAAFLGLITPEDNDDGDRFLGEDMLEKMADQFLTHQVGFHGNGCIIIRASYKGCLVATKEKKELIPPYWTTVASNVKNSRVIDVTGAGSSFCGGLAAGLLKTNYDVFEAALYGAVSASYTVEQLGVPRLTIDERGNESWNDGENPSVRLYKLKERVKDRLKETLKDRLRQRIKGKLKQNGLDLGDAPGESPV